MEACELEVSVKRKDAIDLIKHKIAGDAVFEVRAQFFPDRHGRTVMLIP